MTISLFIATILCLYVTAQDITIETDLGLITGVIENDYVVFKGVSYSEDPPIGDDRFGVSEVRQSSYDEDEDSTDDDTFDEYTYDATQFKPICMQIADFWTPEGMVMNEDCLYLNIYTPNINIDIKNGSINGSIGDSLPVMLWIHGGDFVSGSGSSYDGNTFMSNRDVILVTINYRLGNFGFLSLESIEDENDKTSGGMNGIHDIIVALEWVHEYIADFGGDEEQVTIFGESAGATAVCMLLATELAYDLFHGAIIQSGTCVGPLLKYQHASYEKGLLLSHELLMRAGLDPDDLDSVRDLDATTFLNLRVNESYRRSGALFPSVDNYVLCDTLADIFMNINENGLYIGLYDEYELNTDNIMVGFNSMDSLITFPFFVKHEIESPPTNNEQLRRYLEAYLNDTTQIDLIQDVYYQSSDYESYSYFNESITNYSMLWNSMNADVCYICPGMQFTQLLEENGENVYLYNFVGPSYPYYVPHGGELPFLFNKSADALLVFGTEWNYQLSYFMTETWRNYAIYGVPNSTVFPREWNPLWMDGTAITIQDNNGIIQQNYIANYRNGVCSFWMNEVGVHISSNLCLQTRAPANRSTPVSTPNSDDVEISGFTLETWMIVTGAVGILAIVVVCFVAVVVMMKCCKSSKDEGEYSVLSNEMPKYGAT